MGGFGEGLGRVSAGFWEGFGGSGSPLDAPRSFQCCFWILLGFVGLSWPFLALPGLSWSFPAFSRLSWALLVFAGLCWALTRVIIAGGERSSLVLSLGFPCLPLLSLAHPCFLWLSVASLLCMLSGIFFEWYFGIPSLILYSVSG